MEFVKQSSRLRRLCAAAVAAAATAFLAPIAGAQNNDAEEVVKRMASLGLPINYDGELTDDGAITLANGLTLLIAQSGEVAAVSSDGDLIMAGALAAQVNHAKGVLELDIVTESGAMTLTVYARSDSAAGVVFEGAALIGATSYDISPGWLDVDLSISVNPVSGQCGCLTQLPPITPGGPPRDYKGPGCSRRGCEIQNPCQFRVSPVQAVIDGQSQDEQVQRLANARDGLTIGEAFVGLGGGDIQASDQFPAPGVYEGTCHEEGSEVVALAFLLLAGLGVIWMRRSPVPA